MLERSPTQSEWSRFLNNTKRVHYLNVAPISPRILSLHTVTIYELALGRTNYLIFPHLRGLIAEEGTLSALFMSDTVESLDICLFPPTTEIEVFKRLAARHRPTLIQHICERMPRLTELLFRGPDLARTAESDIVTLIQAQPCLKVVQLPLYEMSSLIWSALAELDHLERIGTDFPEPPFYFGELHNLRSFGPPQTPLKDGAFPALNSLYIPTITVETALSYLTQAHFPLGQLQVLHLRLPFAVEVKPEDVKHLIVSLGKACTSLRTLHINIHPTEPFTFPDLSLVSALRYDHIKDILSFKLLEDFIIAHTHPIEVSEDDLTHLATNGLYLETLWLNPRPIALSPSSLTLRALEIFAQNCPNIWSLGLYMDARSPPEVPRPEPRYQIEHVYVGCSPNAMFPESPECCRQIAEYLAPIVVESDRASITSHLVHDEVKHDDLYEGKVEAVLLASHRANWRIVEEMMVMLFKDRMKRRRESSSLQRRMWEMERTMEQALGEKDTLD